MEHILAGRLAADAEIKEFADKKGDMRELVSFGVYCWSGKEKEAHIYYNITAFDPAMISRIKEMELKQGDSIQMLGILGSNTYTDKNSGKEITRPTYTLTYIDPNKGKDATLIKDAGEALTNLRNARKEAEGIKDKDEMTKEEKKSSEKSAKQK